MLTIEQYPFPKPFIGPKRPMIVTAGDRRRVRRFNRFFDDGHDKAFCVNVSGLRKDQGDYFWSAAMRPYRED